MIQTESKNNETRAYSEIVNEIAKTINKKYLYNKQKVFDGLLRELERNQKNRLLGGVKGFTIAYFKNALKEFKQQKNDLFNKAIGEQPFNTGVNSSEHNTIKRLLENSTVLKESIDKQHSIIKLNNYQHSRDSEKQPFNMDVLKGYKLISSRVVYNY